MPNGPMKVSVTDEQMDIHITDAYERERVLMTLHITQKIALRPADIIGDVQIKALQYAVAELTEKIDELRELLRRAADWKGANRGTA